jgi:hypothetical protein
MMPLARCARSGSFAIPKFDEEPKSGMRSHHDLSRAPTRWSGEAASTLAFNVRHPEELAELIHRARVWNK